MAETTYTYSISADIPAGLCAATALQAEIQASSIVTAMEGINVSADVLEVVFKDALSAGDKTILDNDTTAPSGGLIGAHTGTALPDDTVVKVEEQAGSRQSDKALLVSLATREGSEVTAVTHDLADPTTWYTSSVRETAQACTLDAGNVYDMPHQNIVDITHGKIFLEDRIAAAVGHGYEVKVYDNAVEQTMRAPFATSGGDYELDYETGKITFFSAPTTPVTADYNRESGSVFVIKPPTGKAYDIEAAEAQFTANIVLNDTIQFVTYGWVQVFAPQLWDGYDPAGPYPLNTLIPIDTLNYKKMQNLIDEAQGAFPVIPAIGGAVRGTASAVYGFPFRYGAGRRLYAKYGMETRILLENDSKLTSNDANQGYATATIYYLEKNESDLE